MMDSVYSTKNYERTIFLYRVLCLSKTPTSALMWAHYANNHTGICVAYKNNSIEKISKEVYEVEYIPKVHIHQTDNSVKSLFHNACLRYKSADWAYEEEKRAIIEADMLPADASEPTNPAFQYFPDDNIKRCKAQRRIIKKVEIDKVILGIHTNPHYIYLLKRTCERLNLPLYKAYCSGNSYEMGIAPLNNTILDL